MSSSEARHEGVRSAPPTIGGEAPSPGAPPPLGRETLDPAPPPPNPIVPSANVAGRALLFVIAIMTFLACLTQGTTSLVRGSAELWAAQVSAGATIQIKPTATEDMDRALETARAFALSVAGVRDARILDDEGTADLLAPWLGEGLDLSDLPVPRLVEISVDTSDLPDFAAMHEGLALAVPGATLDDHRTWVDRLVTMARVTILAGTALLGLVLGATALTVVFATRGAMVGNRNIVEVLHFVGAEANFVASEFERHFLAIGARGAAAGCLASIVVFLVLPFVMGGGADAAEAAQGEAMFGRFRLSWWGYGGMALIAALVAIITSLTTGATVRRTLDEMDEARGAGEPV